MSEEILRQPYEISVWNNKQFYLIHNTSNDAYYEVSDIGTLSADEVIVNDYLKEVKQGVIGSDKLDIAYRAFNPKFTSNINGTHKLTFQLSTKYWNEELGQFVFNPWLGMLVNERKIKLKYQGNYYSLIIKQIQESVDTYINTYTCEDIYIEELSKIGYNLEFDTDLENNQGTVKDLADVILVETNWEVDREHSDDIIQYQNEAVYTYSVPSDITPTIQKKYDEARGKIVDLVSKITFPANSTIYLSYSDVESENNLVQCFWVPNDAYETLEDGTITNSNFYFINYNSVFQNLGISLKYRANKLVESIQSVYVPELEQYCQIYKDKSNKKYYLSTENQYMSSVNIQQLISNNMNFISLDGWSTEEGGNVGSNNGLLDNTFENKIHFKIGPNQKIVNSGMYDNRSWFKKGIIKGNKLVLVLEGVEKQRGTAAMSRFSPSIIFKKAGEEDYVVKGVRITNELTFTKEFSNSYFWEFTFNKSIDYDTLVQYGDIQLCFSTTGGTYLVDIVVSRILLFEEHLNKANKVIVPDLAEELSNEVVKKVYYLIDKNLIDTEGRIRYAGSYEDYSELIKTYSPVINGTYEKIRSITGEKSNCFNLLQTLCETFECWIKFNINYDNLGYVTYQYKLTDDLRVIPGKRYYIHFGNGYDHKDFIYAKDPSSTSGLYELIYDKTITFHNYITKFNYAGFRYGINLKSINRKVITDNLVTKLIVEPNNNEYAPDGFCSIQLSDLNVDGENLLFDFSYYFNNGLLSKDNVYRDLYDDSATGGLGYLKKLADINEGLRELIIRQNTLTTTLSRAKAKLQGYEALYNNSLILYEKSIEYITDNYKGDISGLDADAVADSDLYNDQFVEWIRQRDRYKQSADDNKELVDTYQELVDKYTQELKEVETELKVKSDQKAVLHKAFNTKYSAYIKEGSWIDEDYIDPDLYYLDALGVLNTSAQPKVEYSINVLELSELDEYKGYTFNVGDETYVEDTEYFGYDNTGKPVQKWVVVSNVEWSLDDPTQNVITVKTYNDQFDSLFQRITAATQSLQFSEGSYRRAATAVNSNGTLNTALLSRSLAENSAIIQNVSDQSVTWGSDGIIVSSALNGREQVRLVSGGIAITEDGGKTWHTGITGHGINADMITTGQLDTNVINIFAGNSPAFIWNQKGITAYAFDGEGDDTIVSNSKYVTFSQAGIEGIQNGRSIFNLSYDGFDLNAVNNSNYVKINSNGVLDSNNKYKIIYAGNGNNDKFIVYDDGSIKATDGNFSGVINAQDILLPNGEGGFVSILEGNKIKNNYLDLGNIKLNGNDGTITLTGSISFDNAASQSIYGAAKTADALSAVNNLKTEINPKLEGINQGMANLDDKFSEATNNLSKDLTTVQNYVTAIGNGDYHGTFIDGTKIYSPTIIGNTIAVQGEGTKPGVFAIYHNNEISGYMGAAVGQSGSGTGTYDTYGIGFRAGSGLGAGQPITYNTNGAYIVCTNKGVRMTFNTADGHQYSIYANGSGVFVADEMDPKTRINLLQANGTAVFGDMD